jgi:WD40 repeat protein
MKHVFGPLQKARLGKSRRGIRARTSVAISRDGKMLATGHGDGTIVLWRLQSGEEIRRWHAHYLPPVSLDFSPDGKLLGSAAPWESGPRLWQVATGQEIGSCAENHAPVVQLRFSADGNSLRSLADDMVHLRWDVASGQEAIGFRHPYGLPLEGGTLSPHGDVLAAWGDREGNNTLRLHEVRTGKVLHTLGWFPGREDYRHAMSLSFSPDGHLVAFGATAWHKVLIWDVASGKQQRVFLPLQGTIYAVAFAPDGKTLAAATDAEGLPRLTLWDIASGKKRVSFARALAGEFLAFSADGKVLASGADAQPIQVWDTMTGQELRSLTQEVSLSDLALSPDGKWLASVGATDDKVHVWEVLTGQEVRSFAGRTSGVWSVSFAPDGRTLASGADDSTILLWDFAGRMADGRLRKATWTRRELEQRWQDLVSNDGPRAVQAVWDLVASPEQALPLLRQRVPSVQPVDAGTLARLLSDLDSDAFPTRTRATRELERMVDLLEPTLRRHLKEPPSLEVRRRLEQILRTMDPPASERLRALRAVEVLEYMGTPEAKEHLQSLARGAPRARLTREAQAALERLR